MSRVLYEGVESVDGFQGFQVAGVTILNNYFTIDIYFLVKQMKRDKKTWGIFFLFYQTQFPEYCRVFVVHGCRKSKIELKKTILAIKDIMNGRVVIPRKGQKSAN